MAASIEGGRHNYLVDGVVPDMAALNLKDEEDAKARLEGDLKETEEVAKKVVISNGLEASAKKATEVIIKKVGSVKNAHDDDIHALISLGKEGFVSGSKDGALKHWSHGGKLVKDVWTPEGIDYQEWITALSPFGGNRWISGTRNGYVDIWDNSGKRLQYYRTAPVQLPANCKTRNTRRINCISQGVDSKGELIYFLGFRTQFRVYNTKSNFPITYCQTSNHDWVYCINQLTSEKVMVVTGSCLDIWKQQKDSSWIKAAALIKERQLGWVRPFISAVTQLKGYPDYYGLAVFDGSVVVMDITAQKKVRTYKEHTEDQRVWAIENIAGVFASGAEDHTIKLWDVRQPKSVKTIGGNIGRVSTLLNSSEFTLVSGSCPDDLKAAKERAELTYWDVRKL